jgi:hypothetical protein
VRVFILAVILLLTSCGRGDFPFVEQREVIRGGLNGLMIGMRPYEALVAAKRLGATLISPTPCNPFRISRGNLGDMPSFRGIEGIRVTDARGVFVDIYFSGSQVSSVVRSPVAGALPSIPLGTTIQSARVALLSDLKANGDLSMVPIVNHDRVNVLTLEDISMAAKKMQAHQCWMFEVNVVKPAGATFSLTFGSTGLEKILYRRPRIRAD